MTRIRAAHRTRPDIAGPPTSTLWRASGGGRRQTLAVIWSSLFTAAQVWALLTVLALIHPHGVANVALSCALAGSVMAVILAWSRCGPGRDSTAWQLDDQLHSQFGDQFDDQTDQPERQPRDTVRLQGRTKR